MRHRALLFLFVAVLISASCGDEARSGAGGASSPSPSPGPSFDRSVAIIETREGPVMVDVEVAQTPEQRERGLMFRRSLDSDAGMIFIFFEASTSGFWMKNTLIPLSVAFFDRRGEILRILDMKPCRRESCRIYDPGVTYWGALEVNRGAFEDWGVSEGDVIRMNQ